MDNVILVTFEDEGKAYEEFNRLKDNEATADFTILEMAVVKNVDGAIMVPDGYQDGYDETDNTAFGGVIGAVVGLLGGPVGVLLGAGGAGLGELITALQAADRAKKLEQAV